MENSINDSKFLSPKDSSETRSMHSKSDSMIGNETNGIIEELFYSLLQKYQKSLEE